MVCAVVNPTMASKVFKNTEQEVTENENFEGDIKSLDPNFDPKSVEDLLGDDDGIV